MESFIQDVKQVKARIEHDDFLFYKPQDRVAFERATSLFRRDSSRESRATRQRKEQGRRVMNDIHKIGAEVFVLCALAAPYSRLIKLERLGIIRSLVLWWKSESTIPKFAALAKDVCDAASIKVIRPKTTQLPCASATFSEDGYERALQSDADQSQTMQSQESETGPIARQNEYPYVPVATNTAYPLTGDVYGLTVQDVQTIAQSSEIQGEVWLTNTYNMNSSPFITIQISKKLGNQLATIRPQMFRSEP